MASNYIRKLFRTKFININNIQVTELKRCLGVFELTALGIGNTLGAGVYVLTGQVAKSQAGPSVVLSFVIAAVASLLAALCYSEFAARVPRAGSAYVYSYVSVGEIWAFIIGWNMILEGIIGAASVGRAWSQFLDALFNDTIRRNFEDNVGKMQAPGLAEYPDFIAMGLLIGVTVIVAFGVKMSSLFNSLLTVLNMIVIITIIGVGIFLANGHNWTDPPGFFPFGLKGVLSGAATCFYAFVGFDTIASMGEEAINPSRNIPIAIMVTLGVCFLAYFGVATVMTLAVPWYTLSDTAPLPKVFSQRHVAVVPYIVNIGGMFGLTASMMGCIFPLPRTIYAMAQDGLIFQFLAYVHPKTNTPIIGTFCAGFLAAMLAMLLDLNSLVQMMSIGTLMAYSMVAASIIVLRYQPENVGLSRDNEYQDPAIPRELSNMSDLSEGTVTKFEDSFIEDIGTVKGGEGEKVIKYVPSKETTVFQRIGSVGDDTIIDDGSDKLIFEKKKRAEAPIVTNIPHGYSSFPTGSTYHKMDNISGNSDYSLTGLFNIGDEAVPVPNARTRKIVIYSLFGFCLVAVVLCCVTVYGMNNLLHYDWWAILLCCITITMLVGLVVVIARQPKNNSKLIFKVPWVPVIPLVSLLFNLYLMVTLSSATWIRFSVWMLLGFFIYFGYGVSHSSEQNRIDEGSISYYTVSDKSEPGT